MKRELGEQLGLHWMHLWLEQDKKSKTLKPEESAPNPVSSDHYQLTQENPTPDLNTSQ